MLEKLLEMQTRYLLDSKSFRGYSKVLKQAVEILNNKKILILCWLKYTGKTELTREIIKKTKSESDFFYFNPYLDIFWNIKTHKDLMFLMDYKIRTQGNIKIIILEDCNIIQGIKTFILDLYKSKNFKIIIIGNNIKIDWVQEIELFPLNFYNKQKDDIIYWWLPHVRIIPDNSYKKVILGAITSDIIEKEVSLPYHIKNQDNFRKMLAFLASYTHPLSLRELHRLLQDHSINISLITLIEYINIALTTRILIKQEVYDIKKKSSIQTQTFYQFWDTGIRSAVSDYTTHHYTNLLACEYISKDYNINAWKFGTFIFDIYATKWDEQVWIIVSHSQEKQEIRRLARKLSKVPELTHRYVLVENKEKLAMRKFFENGVQICELDECITHID